MIEIRDLSFTYSDRAFRLRVRRLSIPQGQRVAVVGPSGAGKTTLLNLIAGVLPVQAGSIQACGKELGSMGDAARRNFRVSNIGLVFQEFELFDYLTVRDNVLVPYRINHSMRLTSDAREVAERLIDAVGMSRHADRRPTQLSHGQRQRVAVCRALCTSPSVVLADEPTANLDAANKQRVFDLLEAHAESAGATLVVVTHDPDIAGRCEQTVDAAEFSLEEAGADPDVAERGGDLGHG